MRNPTSSSITPAGPCPARVMIVSDAPTYDEVRRNLPLIGYSGVEFDKMLHEAGIERSQCFVTNVLRSPAPRGYAENLFALKKKDITQEHKPLRNKLALPLVFFGLELLKREIEMCRPNVIIALGNVSMFVLTGEWGVRAWRSSILQCDLELSLDYKPKVIPTLHPSAVLRQWQWRQIIVHDLRRASKNSKTKDYTPPNFRFVTQPNFTQVLGVLNKLQARVETEPTDLAVDIETKGGHITCIGLGWSTEEAICIPFMTLQNVNGYWNLDEEAFLVFKLYKLFTHPNCRVLGQNFLYDSQYIYRHWHFIPNLYQDVMLSHHSCFSNMQKSLGFLSSLYSETHVYWKEEGKEWDSNVGELTGWEYNCKDCVRTFEVALELRKVVSSMGLTEVEQFQQSLCAPVLETMNRGLRRDTQRRAAYAAYVEKEIAARNEWFQEVLGFPLNPRSFPQMEDLFSRQLAQKIPISRKTHAPSYDDESLRKIAAREPLLKPLVRKIAEFRSLNVFLSTFINAEEDTDGRVRCSFNIAGTETYRFSSSKNAFGSGLNLQNIPKGGEEEAVGEEVPLELPNVRQLFIPDPGMTFFDIDLDSADLRIVAWEAGVPEMKAMIKEGKKIYVEVMKEYYHDPSLTKKSPQYGTFKSFCHGSNYLGSAKGLAQRLGLSVHEVEILQKWYFGKFPEIQKWHERIKESVIRRRMVENIFGYRTYFFDRIEGTIFNQAVAWIPQSTVACIINRGYRRIYDELKEVQVLLQVHDSLAGQFPTERKDYYKQKTVEACTVTLPYPDDPTFVPVGLVTSELSWGDCS